MDFKDLQFYNNTDTIDTKYLAEKTDNIYKTIIILSKRSNQISMNIKSELGKKLEEFTSFSNSLEEVFENKEQIEMSEFFENLPSSSLIAIDELERDKIYYREITEEKDNK